MKKTYIIALISIAGLFSCESDFFTQVVDLEIPDHDSKIVAYCIVDVSTDTLIVEVSKSQDVLAEEDPVISDATIRFLMNEELVTDEFELVRTFLDLDYNSPDLDSIFKTLYQGFSTTAFLPEQEFALQVSAEQMDITQARASVPAKIEVTKAEMIKDGIIDPEGYTSDELKITFTDPADQENFYLVAAKYRVVEDNFYYDNDIYLNAIDPRINSSSWSTQVISEINTYAYFSDKDGLNGKENTLSFSADIYEDPEANSFELTLRFYSLSKDLYHFIHAFNQYQESDGLFFAEPVTIPTNFDNGYGVFGFYAKTERKITF
jgi:hypothetical protein